ncbi:MAG: alpha/beta hydrolase [Clostridiales bacterium]|nr:alpha/beta hydrolase [Clostridiales bacterium]
MKVLPLDSPDPRIKTRVDSARIAEIRLQSAYGLTAKEHDIPIKKYQSSIRVCVYGDEKAKPLLMVPGNTGDGFVLIPLIAQFKGFRVILMNRPGGGLSPGFDHRLFNLKELAVDSIEAVLDWFEIASAPIIAHSMGGHWSLWFSAERPKRVEKLILPGVPGNVLGTKPPRPLRLAAVPIVNRLAFSFISMKSASAPLGGLAFMGHSKETISALPSAMSDCYSAFQKLPNCKISTLSLMETVSRKENCIGTDLLERIKSPVLMVWGEKDPFGTLEQAHRISNVLPSATLEVMKGAGHLPWLDDAGKVGELASGFIQA